jgi:hypothetical protein
LEGMEIRYQLLKKENLLIQKFIGFFSINDYLKYNKHIIKKFSSILIKKVLIDFRELTFAEDMDKIPDSFNEKLNRIVEIRKKINKNEHKNKGVTLVILVDKPLPTVIALLFVNSFTSMDYNYCSTASKVCELLKLPFLHDNLENILNNLENRFNHV